MSTISGVHPCCHSKESQSLSRYPLLHLAEKISLIAFSLLSLYAEATLFVPFLILGSVIGIQQFKNQAHPEAVEYRSPSCTQGILEQVTGTRLPPLISLIANVSITAYHMLHHAIVFVPIVGVSIGMYLGKKVVFFSNNI